MTTKDTNKGMLFVVIDVGCHECGVSSEVVGVYSDRKTAEKVAEETNPERWRNGGQSIPKVFEISPPKGNQDE